jgi:signal recognition particle subunit SRP54
MWLETGVEVYSNQKIKKIQCRLLKNAINHAKPKFGFNVVIVDTVGRLAIDEQMMNEIAGCS